MLKRIVPSEHNKTNKYSPVPNCPCTELSCTRLPQWPKNINFEDNLM